MKSENMEQTSARIMYLTSDELEYLDMVWPVMNFRGEGRD